YSYDEAIRPRQKFEETEPELLQSAEQTTKENTVGETAVEQSAAPETGEVEIQFGTGTKKVKAAKSTELIPQVPVISHEIGQYEFYPDYDEIERYTGVLQPENLRIFRERLADKGMLHMAKHFFRAAGRFAVECYKRELETAFRSRELAGFQLLDLQDFTGQGTALVGILNAFMENKGLISAEEWREFCNDRVVMLSFPTYVYETGGIFNYEVLVCNMRPMAEDGENNIRITVELSERDSGRVIAQTVHEGTLELTRLVRLGGGSLSIPAGDDPVLLRAAVTVSSCGSEQILMKNHYDLYAYPAAKKRTQAGQTPVTVTDDAKRMMECLRAGERVLFFGSSIGEIYSMEGTYCTDFWCYPMFASISESMGKPLPIGTMGLYMDREHPVFAQFPTEGFTTPQWWRIVTGARVAVLDDQPVEPLIWMIDHFSRNHKLGLVYEAKVGEGSLLVCQADLLSQDCPEVNRFYDSLLAYAESEHFTPQARIEEAWLEKVYQ
ncbi:MAG: beta-glucuronidase, partial [Lachnospiraceae bacterium]|nr:beta-glucuronidase [Lachnospiraceae bacterium]